MTYDNNGTKGDLEGRVRDALDTQSHLREMLFPFGFLITSTSVEVQSEGFPLYSNWPCIVAGNYQILHHPQQTAFVLEGEVGALFLIGHAYDPIKMIRDEAEILQVLSDARREGKDSYIDALNRTTGVFVTGFIEGSALTIYGDATGMQTVFYGEVGGAPYVTSHAALVGNLCGLEVSDYVTALTKYRFYHLFGRALPGDLSPYAELRRLVPNHSAVWGDAEFSVHRFFPVVPVRTTSADPEYREAVGTAAHILRNTMALAAEKWDKPAISLTGGCDSQTTLACATGHYESFRYFSYVSSPEEQADATAAKGIADGLGLKHELIQIPTDEIHQRHDFDAISAILQLNYGNIGPVKLREVEKRIVLRESGIEVEIKSWVSEVARSYYHKRFLKDHLPSLPTARYLTTLYKVFLHDRGLVRKTDAIFQDYLNRYYGDGVFDRMAWWDIIFWEFRVGAWNGSVISGDHRFSFNIDIPYNNRLLLRELLRTSVAARIADEPHRDIRDIANPEVNRQGVSVVNVKHTKARARAERLYLELHSRLPF